MWVFLFIFIFSFFCIGLITQDGGGIEENERGPFLMGISRASVWLVSGTSTQHAAEVTSDTITKTDFSVTRLQLGYV